MASIRRMSDRNSGPCVSEHKVSVIYESPEMLLGKETPEFLGFESMGPDLTRSYMTECGGCEKLDNSPRFLNTKQRKINSESNV